MAIYTKKIGIKAGISTFCMSISISIGIEFQSFMVSVSVSVSKLQTCIVSVSYRYRLFRPGKYQYRIGIEKSGIEDLCSTIPVCPLPIYDIIQKHIRMTSIGAVYILRSH